MTASAILTRARAAGVELFAKPDGTLGYRGPTPALAPLLPELKAHKPDLLRLLAARRSWLITDADGESWSASYSPPAALATVRVLWPDAQAIEPEGES
ncbi:hypothetical protein ABC977_04615 [Thioalkalicoccus limnaeus]|uniref:TubC N-terminal docking domain-containing protein n=1 Tax=Thioalkalicoccus limnaeus TaxID=120681 RepID=A0ABV4BB41_9GAMM